MVEQIHCLQCTCWTNNCSSWLDICTDHLLYSMYPAGKTYALTIFCIPCMQLGQPLPGLGTCKHYHHSHRWLRFPCCGEFSITFCFMLCLCITNNHTGGCASLAAVTLAHCFMLCLCITNNHVDGCVCLAAVSLASHFVSCCICALQIAT